MIWTDAVSVFLLGRVKVPLLKSEYWEYMFWQSTFVPLKIASFFVFFYSLRPTLDDGFVGRSVSRIG